jgi:murein DD-endopeptidase MepM/ murein hydrolase activator NlpD
MADDNKFIEPPIEPDDTHPSVTIRPVDTQPPREMPAWRRNIGLLSLMLAAVLTIGTTLLLMRSSSEPPQPIATPTTEVITITLMPTDVPPTQNPVLPDTNPLPNLPPTVAPDVVTSLLNTPLQQVSVGDGIQTVRNIYNPFTTIPDRPRSEVITYTAVQGDTIYTIAERYKLKPETIGWSNIRRYIEVLRPGDVVNIPPVDGVYFQAVGSRTIADYVRQYNVSDPYSVIDSEYNQLGGDTPDTIPPSGTWIFIPGGTGEPIVWNPGVQVEQGSGKRQGYVVAFAPGQPGSCSNVSNPGGGARWAKPLASYTFMRGFSAIHSGVDLADPEGTPVMAANSGVVIYSGWNTWGYGNLIVLAHGPYLTLYGHLSARNVGCGQMVTVGQVIGAVGTTGNSSGPHLHFEIRNGDTPTDPTATMPF